MTEVDVTMKSGDLLPVLSVTLTNKKKQVADLTQATGVMFRFSTGRRSTLIFEVPAVITDAPNGVVMYAWKPGETDVPGSYYGEFEAMFPDDKPLTFPNGGHLIIQINRSLG